MSRLLAKMAKGAPIYSGGAARQLTAMPAIRAAARALAAAGVATGLLMMVSAPVRAEDDLPGYIAALPSLEPFAVTAQIGGKPSSTSLAVNIAALQARASRTAEGVAVTFVDPDTFMAVSAVSQVSPRAAGRIAPAALVAHGSDPLGDYDAALGATAVDGNHSVSHSGAATCDVVVDGSETKRAFLEGNFGITDPKLVDFTKFDRASMFAMTEWHEFGHCTSTSRIERAEVAAWQTAMKAGVNDGWRDRLARAQADVVSVSRGRRAPRLLTASDAGLGVRLAAVRAEAARLSASPVIDDRLQSRFVDAIATILDERPELAVADAAHPIARDSGMPRGLDAAVDTFARHLEESVADAYMTLRAPREGVPVERIELWRAMRIVGVFMRDRHPMMSLDGALSPAATYNTAPAITAALARNAAVDAQERVTNLDDVAMDATIASTASMADLLELSDRADARRPAAASLPELDRAIRLLTDGRMDAAHFLGMNFDGRNPEIIHADDADIAGAAVAMRTEVAKRGGSVGALLAVTAAAKDEARATLWGASDPAAERAAEAKLSAADALLKASGKRGDLAARKTEWRTGETAARAGADAEMGVRKERPSVADVALEADVPAPRAMP